jgi:hypothetical protein
MPYQIKTMQRQITAIFIKLTDKDPPQKGGSSVLAIFEIRYKFYSYCRDLTLLILRELICRANFNIWD